MVRDRPRTRARPTMNESSVPVFRVSHTQLQLAESQRIHGLELVRIQQRSRQTHCSTSCPKTNNCTSIKAEHGTCVLLQRSSGHSNEGARTRRVQSCYFKREDSLATA